MIRNPKILLVYPPNQLMDIEVPRPDGSLGLLYLASALQRAGFETDVLDVSVGNADDELTETFYRAVRQPNGLIRIGMSQERLREFIAKGGYACVGINSNFTAQTRMALEVAAIAKSGSADIKVIVGGVNARNLAKCFLDSDHVDAVCLTEAEKIIVNKNTIPYDTRSPFDPSGIRIGTAAVTTSGMKEKDIIKIAIKIDKILKKHANH